jgi:alpha-L-fucosidase 2
VVNYWDHLHNGAAAYDSLQVMFRQSTFPNLMDTHPPGVFQIDGNLGAANGMLEALVQSCWMPDATVIELLPALPAQWPEGSIRGLRARGNAVLNMQWKGGKILALELHANSDGAIRLTLPQGQVTAGIHTLEGKPLPVGKDGTIRVTSGRSYSITFQ